MIPPWYRASRSSSGRPNRNPTCQAEVPTRYACRSVATSASPADRATISCSAIIALRRPRVTEIPGQSLFPFIAVGVATSLGRNQDADQEEQEAEEQRQEQPRPPVDAAAGTVAVARSLDVEASQSARLTA